MKSKANLLTIVIACFCCSLYSQSQNRDSLAAAMKLSFRPNILTQTNFSNQSYYTFDAKKLPLFCKIEHQLDKKTPMLIRFRLGSLDYVNGLEMKD
jgi:hypothetical protein